jgi:hypothetical protein
MASCKEYPKRSVPSGTYVSESTGERITATASELKLDLRILTEKGTESVTKVCGYNVHPDSEIWTWGYTSAEYFDIYGQFKWRWDGTAIIRQWAPADHPRRVRGPTEPTRFIRQS